MAIQRSRPAWTCGRTLKIELNPRCISFASIAVMIGAEPMTAGVEGWLRRDDHGFLVTGPDLLADAQHAWPLDRAPLHLESSQPGLFVAGDVRHGSIKRVASAVGEGAMAVALIHQYLTTLVRSSVGGARHRSG